VLHTIVTIFLLAVIIDPMVGSGHTFFYRLVSNRCQHGSFALSIPVCTPIDSFEVRNSVAGSLTLSSMFYFVT
jgi:hypothetical protein